MTQENAYNFCSFMGIFSDKCNVSDAESSVPAFDDPCYTQTVNPSLQVTKGTCFGGTRQILSIFTMK